ncbi:MAG: endonuclease NucS [Candidatus Bathyarchaeia archaeon]
MERSLLAKKPMIVNERPCIDEAVNRLNEAFNERRTVVLVGNCWVNYQGRASSKLEPGERIVIIKEDGSVLVHRSRGYEPVNWQPPGCSLQAYRDNDMLVIRAVRRSPREIVSISFSQIYLLSTFKMVDEGEFSLYASEEDMQKAILARPSIIEEGFRPINYEKKVEPGFIDVYGIDRCGRLVVVEIKRRTAGKDSVLQLAKYIDAVRASVNREVRGILAAPQISKEAKQLLTSLGLDFKRVDPKKCSEILRREEDKKILDFL